MAVAAVTTPRGGPLTQAEQDTVAAAHARAKKLRKAARVAAFNGWVTGIFAAVSAPFALFSLPGFLVTVGLSVVAYNEFRGRRRLLAFDRSGPVLLGWNQLGFLTLILSYCIWMLITAFTGEGPFAAELRAKPELAVAFDDLASFDQLYLWLVTAVYGTVMVLSVLFQGLNSLYYFSRRKHVDDYIRETPAWVLELQRLTPS